MNEDDMMSLYKKKPDYTCGPFAPSDLEETRTSSTKKVITAIAGASLVIAALIKKGKKAKK